MTDTQRYVASEFMGLAPNCMAVQPDVSECEFVLASDYDALRLRHESARAALALIATPPRPDGTWNRDRQACYELAKQELERTP